MEELFEILLEAWVRIFEQMGSGALALNAFYSSCSGLVSVATFVLSALVFFTIAKRRNLDKPWVAWIPCINGWILGKLSDRYRATAYGESTNRAGDLLKHGILCLVSLIIFIHCVLLCTVGIVLSFVFEVDDIAIVVLLICGIFVAATVLFTVFSVRYFIRFYKALYDLYLSCWPSLAVLFVLLSIFVPGGQAVCLMLCRNRDDGMPKPEPCALPEGE